MIVYNVDLVANNSESENLIKMLQRNICFPVHPRDPFSRKNTLFLVIKYLIFNFHKTLRNSKVTNLIDY